MKKIKNRTFIPIILIFAVILFWMGIVITDYTLSTRVQPPIFAQKINASDADIYHGIGYTIIIDDGYAVAPPEAELKGYFYWGWR